MTDQLKGQIMELVRRYGTGQFNPCFLLCLTSKTDRQTDRQTDGRTDRQARKPSLNSLRVKYTVCIPLFR